MKKGGIVREWAGKALKVVTDPEYRAIVWLRMFHDRDLHQGSLVTRMDRYPQQFSACREYFKGRPDVRLLSFGCATGEEVLTLRQYFPSAFIVGAEINTTSLARCRALPADPRVTFLYSDHALISQQGPFDAVFCMAVLQRGPHNVQRQQLTNIRTIYPFEKFDRQVTQLDSLLKTGGLLVIANTQYDLADASVGPKYAPLAHMPHDGFPRFDRQGERKPAVAMGASVFVKQRA